MGTTIYSWVSILYRSLKYPFHILCTSSSPSANLPFPSFILMELSTFPPFVLLSSFQHNSYFHSHLIHLSSKLFICLFFPLTYTPFNLPLFFSVSFHTSFLCLFIYNSQHQSTQIMNQFASFKVDPPGDFPASPSPILLAFLLPYIPWNQRLNHRSTLSLILSSTPYLISWDNLTRAFGSISILLSPTKPAQGHPYVQF